MPKSENHEESQSPHRKIQFTIMFLLHRRVTLIFAINGPSQLKAPTDTYFSL